MYYHYFISYCICIDNAITFKEADVCSDLKITSFEDIINIKKVIADSFNNVDYRRITIINYILIRDEKY